MIRPPPPDDGALLRVSDFHRQHADEPPALHADAGTTRLSALNPSLLQDLLRFQKPHRPGDGLDTMEVLAAALRHGRALLMHLQLDYRVIPLTVQPALRALRCPLPLEQLLALRLPDLRVLRVEPALLIDDDEPGETLYPAPLAPLLWEVAMRGSRDALLPEVAGVAGYRVMTGADLSAVDLAGSMAAAVARMRQQTSTLAEIAGWPGFDRSRATRLLNALYLQSALMVSRTHPGAILGG